MKLQPYEILSQVIPGFILYAVITYFYPDLQKSVDTLPSIGIAFLIGYFVNTLSSFLEGFYFFLWGGKPSSQLLEGKSIWKVSFFEAKKTKTLLIKDLGEKDVEKITNDALFNIALRVTANSPNNRLGEFNSNYALARAIFTIMLIVGGIFIYFFYNQPLTYLIILLLIFISGLRAKHRGYYLAREVLQTYLASRKS